MGAPNRRDSGACIGPATIRSCRVRCRAHAGKGGSNTIGLRSSAIAAGLEDAMASDASYDEHARPPSAGLLLVDGRSVAPPVTEGQARGLAAVGWLVDDPSGLVRVWSEVEAMWARTVERALGRRPEDLTTRVDGEWSFLETLRHLVFVTDGWIGVGVLGREDRHPLGMPPHFVTNGRDLGLDLDAVPTVDEVLKARGEKQALVRDTIASLTAAELARPCNVNLAQFTALGAFQVLVTEEGAHHMFATRDLAKLHDR